jgi:hypothetical protein
MENHVAELEKRLATFEQKKAQLASLHDQLIPIIHRPGWTTLAEVSLVGITMDSLEFHVDSIARIQSKLVLAAAQVDDGHNVVSGSVSHGGPGPRNIATN